MDLIGKKLKHKTLGTGTVTTQVPGVFTIEFPRKTSKFEYSEATFTKFLTAEDPAIQELILQEFKDAKEAAAKKKLEEEMARKKAAETQLAEHAAKAAGKKNNSLPKASIKTERIHSKRMTFYVFQGNTFDRESRGGYIWAPITNKSGHRFHHWDRLLDIRPGDIIFHGYNAHIQAVSIARDACYDCIQPEELRTEDLWDQEGRRVDCDYIVFDNPVKTSLFVTDILRLCNVKYAPFDKDGNGNMGYLYELNRELAHIFLTGIVKRNPELARIDFIADFLSEKN